MNPQLCYETTTRSRASRKLTEPQFPHLMMGNITPCMGFLAGWRTSPLVQRPARCLPCLHPAPRGSPTCVTIPFRIALAFSRLLPPHLPQLASPSSSTPLLSGPGSWELWLHLQRVGNPRGLGQGWIHAQASSESPEGPHSETGRLGWPPGSSQTLPSMLA